MSHIARSTLIIAFFFAVEKGLGFLRQIIIARQFGLSAELDVFNAANNVPDLLFALISGGALAMAFIPVLSETLDKEGRHSAWNLFSRIANLVFLVSAAASVVIALFAEPLVDRVITPGFSIEQRALVAELMRLNLISTLIFSMAGLVIAGLQANQHFLLPAMAPSMYDLGMFVGVLVLAPQEGLRLGPITLPALNMGVRGLVYGTILGAAMFLLIQVPGLLRYGFRWTPAVSLRHAGVVKVLHLLGPRILTVFFIHFVFLMQDNIASRLLAGSVTALVYGWLFLQVPESLIGTAVGTALLPTLSEQATRGQAEAFWQTLERSVQVLLALTLPITLLLMAGIQPVIQILDFDSTGTGMVVWTTRAFLVGLVGYSLIEVAARSFYARQNARIPLLASALAAVTFLVLALPLSHWLGVAGIALSNALAYTGEAAFLFWLLYRQYGGRLHLGTVLLRVIPASLLGALVVYLVGLLPLPALPLALGGMAAGGLVVLPFIWPEIRVLVRL
ncbi:MAG: murein biosynthesis integral membrane protein MurJ [Anaerolineales bacterium]|nr:murein biosynthesis integral membrane protein MurJ [Anaerolineales bacterium]